MIKKIPLYKNKKFLVSIVGFFIIFLMVLSSLNVFETPDNTSKIKYKNYVFNKQDTRWITYINNKPFVFFYNPLDVENLTIPYYNFLQSKLYISYDPKDAANERFVLERSAFVLQNSNIRPVLACYSEKDCPDIPIINCSNDAGLYFKYANDTKVYIEDNCLILQGTTDDQLKYLDKIFFNLLGI